MKTVDEKNVSYAEILKLKKAEFRRLDQSGNTPKEILACIQRVEAHDKHRLRMKQIDKLLS